MCYMKRCRVLILGDSISLGYREMVKNKLYDYCKVMYPKEQGKSSDDIYGMLYQWNNNVVNGEKVDLVYWNAGLWDVVRTFDDKPHAELEQYTSNVVRIANALKDLYPNAIICFANTTSVIEERYGDDFQRLNSDIDKYNAKCEEVLLDKVSLIDDLNQITKSFKEEDFIDATHFTNSANEVLSNHICSVITDALDNMITELSHGKNSIEKEKNEWLESVQHGGKPSAYIWGVNQSLYQYIGLLKKYIDIKYIVDRDHRVYGLNIDSVMVVGSDVIEKMKSVTVISMVNNKDANEEVYDFCLSRDIPFIHYIEVLDMVWSIYEDEKLKSADVSLEDCSPYNNYTIKKYIGVHIKENLCNLDCSYCYLSANPYRRRENIGVKNPHNPKYIRLCMSRDKMGGSCFICLTASGETMLADNIIEVCHELLKEGHYLHIVTNGTTLKLIDKLIKQTGEYSRNILFKLSFQYIQLKEKKLLNVFSEVVELIHKSPSSYTIELMPHDELCEYVDEVKEYSLQYFGAYPHITLGRDDGRKARLLTDMKATDYFDIWSAFGSPMFDLKRRVYLSNEKSCRAGEKSLFIDLYSGNISRCVFDESVGNIYLDDIRNLEINSVLNSCPNKYCYNCHVYVPLNILPMDNVPTYAEIRDRIRKDGSHWIKENMRRYLSIKL